MDLSPDEDNFQGRLLHQAALWDNVELLQELLSNGADVDAKDGNGRTALHAASLCERSHCLSSLCAAGASLDVQSDSATGGKAVCTRNLLFTSVYAGNTGSVHDARVFRLSPVHRYIGDSQYFPENSHLVGDAAYGIHPNIMVPFKDNGHLTIRQKNFNFCLSSARMAIERAFGLWKGRWRRIRECLPMVRTDKVPDFIMATCVLHNICILKNDFVVEANNALQTATIRRGALTPEDTRSAGTAKRMQIVNSLIIRNN